MLAIEDPVTASSGATAPAAPDVSPQRLRSLARAARHDILRRLAPPLRHDMVVHLQALGMVAEALNARLERGSLSQDDMQASVSKLNRLSRQAVATCVEVSTWMQPSEDDSISLREGISECVRLLSTSLNFRGFDLRTEMADGEFEVSRCAVRFLLPAAIFSLTDAVTQPGEVTIRTEYSSSHGVVAVDYTSQPGGMFSQLHESGESPLAWPEVQALASEEGVELLRNGNSIMLRLPRAVVTTPLKMVPV